LKGCITRAIRIALLILALSFGVFAQVPEKAPSLRLRDISGHTFRLAEHKGKVVLINFWATWCAPCRTEIPELVTWQRKYRSRGLQVIGITYPPQTRSEVLKFISRANVNFPIVLGTKATKLLFTSSETLPITLVIDSEGNICDVIEGVVFQEEFDQKIKPLLSRR
jgi:peroxiredoxin